MEMRQHGDALAQKWREALARAARNKP